MIYKLIIALVFSISSCFTALASMGDANQKKEAAQNILEKKKKKKNQFSKALRQARLQGLSNKLMIRNIHAAQAEATHSAKQAQKEDEQIAKLQETLNQAASHGKMARVFLEHGLSLLQLPITAEAMRAIESGDIEPIKRYLKEPMLSKKQINELIILATKKLRPYIVALLLGHEQAILESKFLQEALQAYKINGLEAASKALVQLARFPTSEDNGLLNLKVSGAHIDQSVIIPRLLICKSTGLQAKIFAAVRAGNCAEFLKLTKQAFADKQTPLIYEHGSNILHAALEQGDSDIATVILATSADPVGLICDLSLDGYFPLECSFKKYAFTTYKNKAKLGKKSFDLSAYKKTKRILRLFFDLAYGLKLCAQCQEPERYPAGEKFYSCPCSEMHYCSKTCQIKHWNTHKKTCIYIKK